MNHVVMLGQMERHTEAQNLHMSYSLESWSLKTAALGRDHNEVRTTRDN